jgi:hypothetical protein
MLGRPDSIQATKIVLILQNALVVPDLKEALIFVAAVLDTRIKVTFKKKNPTSIVTMSLLQNDFQRWRNFVLPALLIAEVMGFTAQEWHER